MDSTTAAESQYSSNNINQNLDANQNEGSSPASTTVDMDFFSMLGRRYTTAKGIIWSDDWFFEPATVYNHKLATTSAALSALAYSEPQKSSEALQKLGFASDDIDSEAIDDSKGPIAFTLAYKPVEISNSEGTLIVVAVRGTVGHAEWESDMNISDGEPFTEVHAGFAAAKDIVFGKLEAFLKTRGVHLGAPAQKILIVGHSRGAAVANILAAELVSSGVLPEENTYCYTFAATYTVTAAKPAPNIFNIANLDDIIPRMPLSQWGFVRAGRTLLLPSLSNIDKEEYAKLYDGMNPYFIEITGGDFHFYEKGAAPAAGFAKGVGHYAPTLKDYYESRHGLTSMTVYDLFMALARMMNGGISRAEEIHFGSETLLDFPRMLPFLLGEIGTRHLLFHNHSAEAYLAWMQSLEGLSFGEDDTESMD